LESSAPPRRERRDGARGDAARQHADRQAHDAREQRDGPAARGDEPDEGTERRDDARDAAHADEGQREHHLARAERERRELLGLDGGVDASREQGCDAPPDHEEGAPERYDAVGGIHARDPDQEERSHHHEEAAERPDDAEHEPHELPRAAREHVREQAVPQPQDCRNHAGPSACVRPPTSSRNRSWRLEPARTSATGPATSTRPLETIATWSHMRCTRSIEWLETITVPPLAVYERSTSSM